MKILVIGNGWLGNMLADYLGADLHAERVRTPLDVPGGYDAWVNCAAKTDIDWCEKNRMEALFVNALLAAELAAAAKEKGVYYVFFSSACVFESKDISDIKYEDSVPNPQCYYAETKAMAEKLIRMDNPDSLILRLRLPLSEVPHPRNTIDKILKYPILNTNQESVTVVEDMMPVLRGLIEKRAEGTFHLINKGTISPAEIGEVFGHQFTSCSKGEQDERLFREGRAKRVTAYIGSRKIPLLPDIRERIRDIKNAYVK